MEKSEVLLKAKKLVRHLRAELPTTVPFRFYFREPGNMPRGYGKVHGLCVFNEKGPSFSIFIELGTWAEVSDTIIHELSHVMSWDSSTYDDHGPAWGIAYSIVYTIAQEA